MLAPGTMTAPAKADKAAIERTREIERLKHILGAEPRVDFGLVISDPHGLHPLHFINQGPHVQRCWLPVAILSVIRRDTP